MHKKNFEVFENDLPDNFELNTTNEIAIDTETTGLNVSKDRLCVIQLSWGDNYGYLIQIRPDYTGNSPNLCKILSNKEITKLFHFGRFDIAMLYKRYGVLCENVFCTKIASYFTMTYTERHGLKEVCRQFAGVEISKGEQSSYWGAEILTDAQKEYAISDVLYLHTVKSRFIDILKRENKYQYIEKCMEFLPHRAKLDAEGWEKCTIFDHYVYGTR